MSKFWSFILILLVGSRTVLSQVVQNHAIQHFSRLGGLTGLEVGFQRMMNEFLILCGASSLTCNIFEYTSIGLYFTGCFFLTIEGFWQLLVRMKKEIREEELNKQKAKSESIEISEI